MIDTTMSATNAVATPEEARLRRACAQMEGLFLAQLMKAMRETIPQDGAVQGGAGEDMFTTMMDEHVSDVASARQERGLGAALFRQLRDAFLTSNARLERTGSERGVVPRAPVDLGGHAPAGAAAATDAAAKIGVGT
jgi:peptidoglycan hydrolase FlgJ